MRLGPTQLKAQKLGFASLNRSITLGWGSNPLGSSQLTPQAAQFSLQINDFLSGAPVAKAETNSADASALSDDKGLTKLTVDKPSDQGFDATITKDGYRSETVHIDTASKETKQVKLVPARKSVYVSKKSGKYDVYSVYIDGQDEQVILPGHRYGTR